MGLYNSGQFLYFLYTFILLTVFIWVCMFFFWYAHYYSPPRSFPGYPKCIRITRCRQGQCFVHCCRSNISRWLAWTGFKFFFYFIKTVAIYCLIIYALLCNPLVRTVTSYHRRGGGGGEALWHNSVSV